MSVRLLIVLLAAAVAFPAVACRIILPPQPPIPMPPHRPVLQEMQTRSHKVSIEAADHTAQVTVQATFFNPNGRRIEGTYVFPIAKGASVSSFSMTVNGKTLEAELFSADKARAIYEGIVRSQKDPALLEYLDDGLLQARVFPIEPHSEVKIELTYEQRLTRDGGITRLQYPLLSAKPGGNGRIGTLTIDTTITTKAPLTTVYTPGFESSVKNEGKTARVTLESANFLPTKDFEIVFATTKDPVGLNLLTYRKGEQGYFLLFMSPNSELQADEIAAKDITFVIDTSGSMNGASITQAKEALRFCVNSLNKGDSFNIVSFSTDVLPLAQTSLPVTDENRTKALAFIDSLRARGGTAIDDALATSLKATPMKGKVPIIVFLTDGRPTIGEVSPEKIQARVAKLSTDRRIFTIGVGNDVHTHLLDAIADSSRGYTTYVRPEENLELALSAFYDKVASPVMTDLALDTGKVTLTETLPKQLPDLFRGSQVVLTGRYTGSGSETFTLSGDVAGNREKFRVKAELDGDPRNAFIPRLWAVRRVGFLQDQIRLNGSNAELVSEIKRLGREHGILTPYTSYLVVEEGLALSEREAARKELQSYGMSMNSPVEMPMPTAPATGRQAVDRAQSLSKMRAGSEVALEAEALDDFKDTSIRLDRGRLETIVTHAGDKTFYRRASDDTLYDSEIPANQAVSPDVTVKAYSTEFFALLKKHPKLATYMQAGLPITLILNKKTVRVVE